MSALRSQRLSALVFVVLPFVLAGGAPLLFAQTLVNHDDIPLSGVKLEIAKFAQLPLESGGISRMTFLTTAPGDDDIYVATHGRDTGSTSTATIYKIDTGGVAPVASPYFSLGAVLDSVNGDGNALEHSREGGLRSFAFHPDFDDPAKPGYRKFYTSQQEKTAGGNSALPYLGPTTTTDISDSVVGEWTVGADGLVDASSYREVLRVALPWYTHPSKQVGFNPLAEPGDEDYGLLYYGHGDAGLAGTPLGTGQLRNDARGKILRINPLQDGANSYSVPASNPFTADNDPSDTTLDEIYALGFRSPHRFTWAEDDQGNHHMIVADIGQDNVEEINVVVPGGDYGWRLREGTFQCLNLCSGTGLGAGINPLPSNDWAQNDFIYPAAQYGHDGSGPLRAIGSGQVIQNGSALDGQYIFTDFPEEASTLHVPLEDLLSAKTTLELFEQPSQLAPATLQELGVLFDDDNDPQTPALDTTLEDVIKNDPDYEGGTRTEAFFYTGQQGEVYITNKRNRWVYLVSNSLPASTLDADFDGDGDVDGSDFLILQRGFGVGSTLAEGDTNNDGVVDATDVANWESLYAGGAPLSAGQQIPEPSTLLLLLIGVGATSLRRCRGRSYD
ncbi:MAG: PQQ-dependent sugar dehydrogenase [Planctomycetota bacterium]